MVFENVTFVELHIHETEDTPLVGQPSEKAPAERSTESVEDEEGGPAIRKALAMVGVSIGLSLLVTAIVKRVVSQRRSDEDGSKAVVEIIE